MGKRKKVKKNIEANSKERHSTNAYIGNSFFSNTPPNEINASSYNNPQDVKAQKLLQT